jgi:hypothetical protein
MFRRSEGERGFAAATRARDDGQLAKRQIDIDTLQIVLTCAANLDAIMARSRCKLFLFPDRPTHWRQFQIAARFANFWGAHTFCVLV